MAASKSRDVPKYASAFLLALEHDDDVALTPRPEGLKRPTPRLLALRARPLTPFPLPLRRCWWDFEESRDVSKYASAFLLALKRDDDVALVV